MIGNPVLVFFRLPNASEANEKLLTTSQRQVIIKCNVVSRVRERFTSSLSLTTLNASKTCSNSFCYSETAGQVFKPTEDCAFNELICRALRTIMSQMFPEKVVMRWFNDLLCRKCFSLKMTERIGYLVSSFFIARSFSA